MGEKTSLWLLYTILTTPRGRNALESATFDPIDGLYTYNNTIPLGRGGGLRDDYRFGLYGHCAYISNVTQGLCVPVSAGAKYQPYEAIVSDMPSKYANTTNLLLPESATAFRNDGALGTYTTAAYWLILLATVAVLFAFILYASPAYHVVASAHSSLQRCDDENLHVLAIDKFCRPRDCAPSHRSGNVDCDGEYVPGCERLRDPHAIQYTPWHRCARWPRSLDSMGRLRVHVCIHSAIHDQVGRVSLSSKFVS
jgi:hypothetical protein